MRIHCLLFSCFPWCKHFVVLFKWSSSLCQSGCRSMVDQWERVAVDQWVRVAVDQWVRATVLHAEGPGSNP